MWKRLGLGLLKGVLIGGAVGAGLQLGAPSWGVGSGLLGFLVAMGASGTAGVFAGKAPWLEGAWIEALLKGLVGVGLGALAYWGLSHVPLSIPFPPLEGVHPLSALPLVYAPATAGVYGALVELDNTGDDGEPPGPKARVRIEDEETASEEASSRGRQKRRRRA